MCIFMVGFHYYYKKKKGGEKSCPLYHMFSTNASDRFIANILLLVPMETNTMDFNFVS